MKQESNVDGESVSGAAWSLAKTYCSEESGLYALRDVRNPRLMLLARETYRFPSRQCVTALLFLSYLQ